MVFHRNLMLSGSAVRGLLPGLLPQRGPAVTTSVRRFRPGWASTLVVILLFPGLSSLGFWQLDRARQKRELEGMAAANRTAPPFEMQSSTALTEPSLRGRAASAGGRYVAPTLLLENRFRAQRNGYEVLTPFVLDDGSRMLVARGWVEAGPDRARPPVVATPKGAQRLHGRVDKAPVTGLRLGRSDVVEQLAPELLRLQRLDADVLARALGHSVPADVFYLDPGEPNGYDRAWPEPATDVGKHQAYALQWFAMAIVLLLLYIRINVRPE